MAKCDHPKSKQYEGPEAVDGGWWYVTKCACGHILKKNRRLSDAEVRRIRG